MYNKIKKFSENCWENKSLFRIFLVMFVFWFIVVCSFITLQDKWSTMFTYPENDYKAVKAEAERIISSKSFDTTYFLEITHYSNTYNTLSFELSDENNTSITVNVNNYGLENEEVSYTRFSKNPTTHVLKELLAIVLLIVLITLFSMIVILVLISVVWLIAFIIHKIVEHNQQKK